MIPDTLTPTAAERLLQRGRARLVGARYLTTPRATYAWAEGAACFTRIAALPCAAPSHMDAPQHVPATLPTVLRRLGHLCHGGGVLGMVSAWGWWAVLESRIPGSVHCLVSDSPHCLGLRLGAVVSGYVPYTPRMLWGSAALWAGGVVLLLVSRPHRALQGGQTP